MKKILFAFACCLFIIPNLAKAQCCFCFQSKVNSNRFLNATSVKADAYEGFGIGYTGHFRKDGSPRYVNPYIGVEINQSSVGGTAGIRPALYSGSCFKTHFVVGVAYLYRTKIVAIHGSLLSETVREEKNMAGTFRIGPSIELKRFGLSTTFNPGVSWNNHEPLTWNKNFRYYWGGEISLYVLF